MTGQQWQSRRVEIEVEPTTHFVSERSRILFAKSMPIILHHARIAPHFLKGIDLTDVK
jgi:hypothetical protein